MYIVKTLGSEVYHSLSNGLNSDRKQPHLPGKNASPASLGATDTAKDSQASGISGEQVPNAGNWLLLLPPEMAAAWERLNLVFKFLLSLAMTLPRKQPQKQMSEPKHPFLIGREACASGSPPGRARQAAAEEGPATVSVPPTLHTKDAALMCNPPQSSKGLEGAEGPCDLFAYKRSQLKVD